MRTAIKAVAFQHEQGQSLRPLLETFRMMVNHALWVGMHEGAHGHFKLIRIVYDDFKRYGLHTHYTLSACEVAAAILKGYKRNHRRPVAKRLFLKLDNQTYRLKGNSLLIPIKPREFFRLKLKFGNYQRRFLRDPTLKLGSVTLTESKVIVAYEKASKPPENIRGVIAYDTNELSLDAALSDGARIEPIHVDLRRLATIRAHHFQRRRRIQSHLAHSGKKLGRKLAEDRGRERRRIDAILHSLAKDQVNLAKKNDAKIVLEDLKNIRRTINKRVRRRNGYCGKLRSFSVRSKSLKRRLNSWPFRRLHGFLEYKAKWEGVPLSYVPAWNTSCTCARCGCLQTGHRGVQDPKTRQMFRCPKCGWTCNRHLNAALNLLKTQDEGRWFSPDRLPNEAMTATRAYGEEDKPSQPEDLAEPSVFSCMRLNQ